MVLGFFLSLICWAFADELALQEGEQLWLDGKYDQSIQVLEGHVENHPDDVEALWRLARSYYSLGETYAQDDRDKERLALYATVLKVSKQLQKVDPSHGQGPFWHGVALGRISTTKGALSQASTASKIESLWLRSLESDHTYIAAGKKSAFPASAHYALGQFYRIVPDAWWVKLLTGVRGDIDKSIAFLDEALVFNPNWLEARKELGVSYLCKAKREKDPDAFKVGTQHLASASTLNATTPTEKIDISHIPIIQARWKEACDYSRDGWQDFSEKKMVGNTPKTKTPRK